MRRVIIVMAMLFLTSCGEGPTENDMRGCTTTSARITARDVADCAIDRRETRNRTEGE